MKEGRDDGGLGYLLEEEEVFIRVDDLSGLMQY